MNIRAGQKLLSIWWFFMLIIVGGGMVLGVFIYHGSELSVNSIEAKVLSERITDCIIKNYAYQPNQSFDIFSACVINKNLFEKGGNIYFNVSIYSKEVLVRSLNQGDYSFEENCKISDQVNARFFPGCYRTKRYFFDGNNSFNIIVLAGVNYAKG